LYLIESALSRTFKRLFGLDSGGAGFNPEFAAGVDQSADT
jgi:hypothetical protein